MAAEVIEEWCNLHNENPADWAVSKCFICKCPIAVDMRLRGANKDRGFDLQYEMCSDECVQEATVQLKRWAERKGREVLPMPLKGNVFAGEIARKK